MTCGSFLLYLVPFKGHSVTVAPNRSQAVSGRSKQVTNVLVKRGKELHGPDRMYLNANQIIFVEPVGPASKVAQLIDQANQ